MNFDKFTDRSRGFIQSAQGLASRANHQQLLPEHLLKVLVEDQGGTAARLISAGGRRSRHLPGGSRRIGQITNRGREWSRTGVFVW